MQIFSIASLTAITIAYLIGSISFGVIVSKLVGISDPRTYGSHNPGATNVLRSGHKLAAALTLMGDALKGWAAIWLASLLHLAEPVIALVAVAVFVGHLWPVFFKFIGGKGVATAAGILLGLNGWLGLGVIATWLIAAICFRYSSLAALIATILAPIYAWFIFGIGHSIFAAICVICVLVIARHQKNIRNLINGTESRIRLK